MAASRVANDGTGGNSVDCVARAQSQAHPLNEEASWRILSQDAREVLVAAKRLAGSPPYGARHVACVLFCHHPVGPRLAWATCTTDVPSLRRDLERYAALPGGEVGVPDDLTLLIELAQAQRHGGGDGPQSDSVGGDGTVDIGDMILALFENQLHLAPILASNGLTFEDARDKLPSALRAMRVYEASAALRESQPLTSLGDSTFQPKLSKAMRTVRGRDLTKEDDNEERRGARLHPSLPSSSPPFPITEGGDTVGENASSDANQKGHGYNQISRPFPEEVPPEMAELAPRAAKRAAVRRTALAACGVDLVERARAGHLDPVVGRDEQISRVLQILSRRTKNNVCLVGAPGVGKTAVAEAVAQRLAAGHVPPQLRKCKELWTLDVGALLAGTGLRGDFEERLRDVLAEIRAAEGEALLFVDELHLLLGAGRSENNNVDAANLMKPMLARGEIRCIGATTSDEYKRLILTKDAAFERRFQVVELLEPSPLAACAMLRALLPLYSDHHKITISLETADAAVELAHQRIHGRSLPDKAIDVLDEACCFAVDRGETVATRAHVESVISRWQPPPWQHANATLFQRALTWFTRHRSRL
eukprot:TRINITY_DN29556_c0_g1_i1.p1 TRINITY_DN29556_c0_g1~~TRINITY_DN29556_c0_g1_i1.p1  ORF type:complete len:592 (+),score=88.06 TRINITY_DN29556_c0_g1_i1:178-1953(+)